MRSNRNDCALASSASPRESWNDECRWQSIEARRRHRVAAVDGLLAGVALGDLGRLADRGDLAAVHGDRRVADDAAARGSTVISQSMSLMMRSTVCNCSSDSIAVGATKRGLLPLPIGERGGVRGTDSIGA